jgi:TIR domain
VRMEFLVGTGVYLSYAEQDAKVAEQIVAALARGGIAVAPTHPPQQPPGVKQVPRELTSAKCVVVLWSDRSVQDERVLAEADYARSRGIVVSAVIGKPPLPLGFRDVWFANLTHWTGEPDREAFLVLKRLVDSRLNPNSPQALPRIFLCYRRDDTQDAAGRLHDRLVDAFGPERVFMDIDSVPLGIDFVEHVTDQIRKCSAVIVMIGKQWQTIKDKKRRRRLDNEDDLVRAEIRAALQQKIPVIPVTVQNAAMPQAEDLPDDIRLLARRNGIELSATRWRTDVERLIKELDRVMKG